jgi:hypothetical protein
MASAVTSASVRTTSRQLASVTSRGTDEAPSVLTILSFPRN